MADVIPIVLYAGEPGQIQPGDVISGAYGGTGSNNSGKTIIVAANFETSGAFAMKLNATAITDVVLPTSGTLYGTKSSSISSSQFSTSLSDKTGTGVVVFGTSPIFTTDITAPLVIGSSSSAGSLTLSSTSHATKGKIIFGNSQYDEAIDTMGIGTASPTTSKLLIADTVLSGSGSLTGNALRITQTWSTSGVATAILLNVTNTASNVLSKLLDLQVAGVTQLSVGRTGNIYSASNIISSLTLASDPTIANANFEVYSRLLGIVHASGLAGSANTTCGVRMGGALTSVITANYSAAGTLINSRPITVGTSGTHPVFAALAIKPLTITTGSGTLTNSATLYVDGVSTGATNNYAVLVNTGKTRVAPSTTSAASFNVPSGTAPSSPVDGDMWYDGTNIYLRVGGTTKTFTLV